MAKRHHVVITGTGRCGTTFLVELLTHLGLETGFTIDQLGQRKHVIARAGLEFDVRKSNAPYIAKHPRFSDYAAEVLASPDIAIDHVFIPIRDLSAAAESRRQVTRASFAALPLLRKIKRIFTKREFAGGVWTSTSLRVGDQERLLLDQIYRLTLALADAHVPVTLLRYPRLVHDSDYLFEKLAPALGEVDPLRFRETFDRVARPELVHSFSADDQWKQAPMV
ncbi:MAG: hypothetical protein C0478_06465 [Planctomyces sp.]|nr:hypothetical protein [Planctomyces sp.]